MLPQRKRSARSISPGPNWVFSPRKLFNRQASSSSLKDVQSPSLPEDQRSIRSSGDSRSRDISPESLRRFLVDDSPCEEEREAVNRPVLTIPENIAEEIEDTEDAEDDANFATSATSETVPFTVLSPPPSQRSLSPSPSTVRQSGSIPSTASVPEEEIAPAAPTRTPPTVPQSEVQIVVTQSRFSVSDSSLFSVDGPESPDSISLPSFYHSDSEDEEADDTAAFPPLQSGAVNNDSVARNFEATFSTYSLPRSLPEGNKLTVAKRASLEALGSPALVARNGTDMPLGNTSLLTSPIPDSGLEDLVNELGWMADVIAGKVV